MSAQASRLTCHVCSVCGEGIPSGDLYACGISLAGWPHQVPQTLYCHRGTCKGAAEAAANAAADEAERRRSGGHQVASSKVAGVARASTPSAAMVAGDARQVRRGQLAAVEAIYPRASDPQMSLLAELI